MLENARRSSFSSLSPTFATRKSLPAVETSRAKLTLLANRYYKESHKILGNTYGMCVLQDFEAITPNLLARTIETVEGGGIVVLMLKTMTSLRQLYSLTMVRAKSKLVRVYKACLSSLLPGRSLPVSDISTHRRRGTLQRAIYSVTRLM